MPLRQHTNGWNTLYMSNMDVWSGLMWISASTMRVWQLFHSTSDPESQIWGQLGQCNGIRVHPHALETAWQWLKRFFMCLVWMYEAVWGGYQPQPWCYGIILIPQVTLISQIGGQLCWCNDIQVHLHALEKAYQWLTHCIYAWYRCMKWFEVDISFNHDIMPSSSLHMWTLTPKSGANLAGVTVLGCTHMPLRHHTNGSNILYISNMDGWSGLRLISASTMMLWHCFTPQVSMTSQTGGLLGWCNGTRVHSYALETAY